jgi:hypothetical protein
MTVFNSSVAKHFRVFVLGLQANINKVVVSLHILLILLLISCTSMQMDDYDVPKQIPLTKSETVTFELVEILNKGDAYKSSPEEFQKTEEWLLKALQGGGFPDAKPSKSGVNSNIHIRIKIDVYNPPWYRMLLGYLNATATVGTLGIIPYYIDGVYHIFYFDVSRAGKPIQNYKIEGPELTFWWGWLAPLLGNRGDSESLIIESWKLIVLRLNPQIEKARI